MAATIPSKKPTGDYNIGHMISACAAQTFGKVRSHEYTRSMELQEEFGMPEGNAFWVPGSALMLNERDLTAANASAGGYLAQTSQYSYVATLQPYSVMQRLGAQVQSIPTGANVVTPKTSTGFTTYWLSSESSTPTEGTPTLVQLSGTPKWVSAYAEISRQLWLQSNAEAVVKLEFARAVATALDVAGIQGTGNSGQPLGMVNVSGIGTFTGASMSQAHIRNAQTDIAGAVINPDAVGFATTPAHAEVLATRQRFTGSSTAIWEGKSIDGTAEGMRAISSANVPSGTAICADFSTVWILAWDQMVAIEVNPYADFKAQIIGIRIMLPVDIVCTRPTAISVATSAT